jgi:hypothetical protein
MPLSCEAFTVSYPVGSVSAARTPQAINLHRLVLKA